MFFFNPTYLWAFIGLSIPIAIHLWSKKQGKTIKIGSIALLSESESKQSSRIQLNELLLLFLRILTICCVVLILTKPYVKRKINHIPLTYIVEASLLQDQKIQSILDTMTTSTSIRILEDGLPELKPENFSNPDHNVPKYWQLVKEIEALPTDSIVIFTKASISGIKGKRPKTQKHISWIIYDTNTDNKEILKAVKKENNIQLLSFNSNSTHAFFEKTHISSNDSKLTFNPKKDSVTIVTQDNLKQLPLSEEIPIKVLLYYNEDLSNEMNLIKASIKTISTYLNRTIDLEFVKKTPRDLSLDTYNLIIWLSKSPVPKTLSKQLVYNLSDFSNQLIEPSSSSTIFNLTRPLTIENVVDEHFTEQLLTILDLDHNTRKRAERYDTRTLKPEELSPIKTNGKQQSLGYTNFEITHWFWFALLLILILERIVAKFKKQ